MQPDLQDDFWLSALSLPLVVVTCVAFILVMAAGSPNTGTAPDERRRVRKRRQKQEIINEWELVRHTIPVEVVEQIIDYIRDDKRTLKACTLVGRAWVSRSRFHLHSTLSIRRGGPDPYKLRHLPAVARCIRHVTVRDGLWDELKRSVLVDLGYVDHLHIRERTNRVMSLTDFPNLPSLVELRLENVYFGTKEELFSVLETAPKLETLFIDLAAVNYTAASDSQEDVPLHSDNSSTIPKFSLPLRKLHLLVREPPGEVAREILAIAGNALSELTILIYGVNSTLNSTLRVVKELGLRASTSLDTLSLRFHWTNSPWYSRTEDFAPSLLACIHSPLLRTVDFYIVVPPERDLLLPGLRHFDVGFLDAFAQPPPNAMMSLEQNERAAARSNGLQHVGIELGLTCRAAPEGYSDIRRHIERQLPELRRRNILQVKCRPCPRSSVRHS